jgi:hypothetical protein
MLLILLKVPEEKSIFDLVSNTSYKLEFEGQFFLKSDF